MTVLSVNLITNYSDSPLHALVPLGLVRITILSIATHRLDLSGGDNRRCLHGLQRTSATKRDPTRGRNRLHGARDSQAKSPSQNAFRQEGERRALLLLHRRQCCSEFDFESIGKTIQINGNGCCWCVVVVHCAFLEDVAAFI